MALAVVILAAGQGTRMKSALPKVLHEAAGRPLLEHVLRAVAPLNPEHTVVVIGHGAEAVRARFSGAPVVFVEQREQLGTGHALLQAGPALAGFDGAVMVLNGDGPLLRTETLAALLEAHQTGTGITLLTCRVSDPRGLGRIVRGEDGSVQRIVEEKDATEAEKQLSEINPGIYLFDSDVFRYAGTLSNDNAAGEYYITDLVALYREAGKRVTAVVVADETEVLGVNDRQHLAQVDRLLRDRIRARWLQAGVTMIAPEQVFIDDTVELSPDVVLYPGVWLRGRTVVGSGVTIGPYAVLTDCEVGPGIAVAPFTAAYGERLGQSVDDLPGG